MAKTNKPNPLKYFNDEHAKRVAKLTKAQPGIQTNAAQNAKDILSRYDSMNKDTTNIGNKNKERPWTGTSTLNENRATYLRDLWYYDPNTVRDAYIKNITGQDSIAKKAFKKYYPDTRPSPIFIDPNTGGIKKSGGQTKSKKK